MSSLSTSIISNRLSLYSFREETQILWDQSGPLPRPHLAGAPGNALLFLDQLTVTQSPTFIIFSQLVSLF